MLNGNGFKTKSPPFYMEGENTCDTNEKLESAARIVMPLQLTTTPVVYSLKSSIVYFCAQRPASVLALQKRMSKVGK